MNVNVILTKKAGLLIPESAIQLVLLPQKDWTPSVSGFAIQAVENGKPYLAVEQLKELPTIEEFMELQNGAKDCNAMFIFGSGEYEDGGIQPFDLFVGDDSAKSIFMVAALEGDFPHFAEGGNEPFNLMKEIINPSIEKLFGDADIDIEKLRNELNDKLFHKNLSLATGHRGEFVFMLPTGDPVRIVDSNKLGDAFDWGTMSNTLGYTTPEAIQEPTPAPVAKKWGFGSKKVASTSVPAVPPKEDALPAGVHKVPEKTEKPVAAPDKPKIMHDLTKGKMYDVPINKAMKNRIKWYSSLTGKPVSGDVDLNQKQIYILNSDLKNAVAASAVAAPQAPLKDFKDLQKIGAAANASKPTMTAKASEANAMVLSVEEKTKTESTILKFLDQNSNGIAGSVKDLQAIEEKYPKFTEQVGINLEDTFFWSKEQRDQLSRKDLDLLFIETRRALIGTYKAEDLAKAAPPVKQEEKIAPAPAAAPDAAKKGWGFGKKKVA